MKKRAFALMFMFTLLTGCTISDPKSILPDVSVIQKAGHNIKKFAFTNIPDEGIKRGLWDVQNIHLVVTYDDDSTYDTQIKMKNLPRDYRNLINTVGTHTFEILFRGDKYPVTIKILESDVTFDVNYYDYSGTLIQHSTHQPGETFDPANIPGPVEREEDYRFIYTFDHWEEDLANMDVYQNFDIYPFYVPTLKRDHLVTAANDVEGYNNHLLFVSDHAAFFHLGRIYRARMLINSAAPVYHTQNSTAEPEQVSFKITWAQSEAEMKRLTKSVVNYLDDSSTYQTKFKDIDISKLNLDNCSYMSATEGIEELLGGHMETSLTGKEGEKFKLFEHHFGTSWTKYENNKEFKVTIPSSSLTGYYNLAMEADIDIIYMASWWTSVAEPSYNFSGVFLTLNFDTLNPVMDYTTDGNFVGTTPKMEIKYSTLMQDIEKAAGLEG